MPARTVEMHAHKKGAYFALLAELIVDFVIMYLVMFTMIATLGHFWNNINTFYMTLMMVAPMAVVMLVAMPSMFPDRRANVALGIAAALVFAGAFYAMRDQSGVGNTQFLRSMIPHHSGAILMCREASVDDPRILDLCRRIIDSQQKEIAEMEAILAEQG